MPEFIDELNSKGYTEMAEKLKKYYRNAIGCFDKEYAGEIPIGASKIGGFPDLPPEIEYPTMTGYTETCLFGENKGKTEHYEKSAMQLMTQINLYELAESGADLENLLPKTGMLYIFWSGEGGKIKSSTYYEVEIAEPDKVESHKVIYWDGDMSTLKRTAPPCPYYSKYFDECLPEQAVEFDYMDEYEPSAEYEVDGFIDVLDIDPYDLTERCNKLFGFPKGGNAPQLDDNEVLLFQGDYSKGCLWSEYWIMKKSDLKNLDFSRVLIDFDTD